MADQGRAYWTLQPFSPVSVGPRYASSLIGMGTSRTSPGRISSKAMRMATVDLGPELLSDVF